MHAAYVYYIGRKESNRIEDVETGLVHDLDEVLERYDDPGVRRERVIPVLRAIPQKELAELAGVSPRWIRDILNEEAAPSRDLWLKLLRISGRWGPSGRR